MKLKCIGGERDGEWFDVESVMRVGDIIRVPAFPKSVVFDFQETLNAFRENRASESMMIQELIYRIAVFHFAKDDYYKFLVSEYPIKLTDKQAILSLFDRPKSFKFFDPVKKILRDLMQEDLDKINTIHGGP